MKRVLLAAAVGLAAVAVLVLVRTLAFSPSELPPEQIVDLSVDADAVARHMSEAIRFETISNQPPTPIEPAPFDGFIDWLEQAYPQVHRSLLGERIAEYTLLFTWAGSDPSLRPVLLTGHYDVVPVIPGTEDQWEHPPFAGDVAGGYVWGRGALDDKSAVVTILEAATLLLEQGFQPRRTVFLSFGHDEEIGGLAGAAGVAAHLKARGVQLAWSLDEGSFLMDGTVPGLGLPVAMINVAEKGYVTLDLAAKGEGGHSSAPSRQTAVGVLAEGLVALQSAPIPGGLDGLTAEMFDTLARHMSFQERILFANRWLFGPLLEYFLSSYPGTDAMLRTTTAPTMLSASVKENVLPIEAVATVNFRLHPRDTVEGVVDHVTAALDDDRIEVRLRRGDAASPVSRTDSEGWASIVRAVRETYGDVIVAPGLTIAGTDTKHYGTVADDSYRFKPMIVTSDDMSGFHGTNERISVENLVRATVFYAQLIRHGAGG